jgi:hypothetical protein
MALQLPGIQYLKGYDRPDIIGEFAKGFGLTSGIRNEEDAQAALGDYVKSLYMGGQPQAKQPAGAMGYTAPGLDTGTRMINGSMDAVKGATDPTLDAYFGAIRAAESGGNDAAKNPNSSATGRYQFTEGTWNGLVEQHPELGLTPDGRTDPVQQERAIRQFTSDNIGVLRGKGIPINPGNLYASHFLGSGGASQVLGLSDDTPMVSAVSPEVVQANPFLAEMTVGDFKQWTANKAGNGSGGYRAPMEPQDPSSPSGAPYSSTASTAGNGLPPQDVMLKLFRNPNTREFAQGLVTAAQKGTAPPALTDDMKEYMLATQDPAFARFLNKSNPPTPPANVGEYNFYAEQEKAAGRQPMSFIDFQAAQKGGGLTVTTNPDGTTTVTQGGPGKLTEAQGKDIGFYTRGLQANTGLTGLESQLTDLFQSTAGALPGVGNYLRTPEFRQAKVEGDNFLTALLRKDTGAAITDKEFELYGPMFLPIPGDDPATMQLKRQKRATALLALRSGLGTAEVIAAANEATLGLDRPDAAAQGGDQPPASPQTQEDYDALPSGALFVDPDDGQTYRKP